MLTGIYHNQVTDGKNFEVKYPALARKTPEYLTVTDKSHGERLLMIRTKKYLFETLRGWVMQRQHAINAGENHFKPSISTKNVIVEKFLLMLMSNYESSLPRLICKIAENRWEIEQLAPSIYSKYYNHYEEVILPILEWTEEMKAQLKRVQAHN